jgi:hypothetical protein
VVIHDYDGSFPHDPCILRVLGLRIAPAVYAAWGASKGAVGIILQRHVARTPRVHTIDCIGLKGRGHAAVSTARKPGVLGPDEAARVVARLQHGREEERSRLSRTLHHDVSGLLAAARMELSRLAARTAQEAGSPELLLRIDELLEQVIGHVRDEMQRLHPALIDHFGITVALRQLIEEKCREPGRRYAVAFADDTPALDPPLPIALFRLVEALLEDDRLQELGAAFRPNRDGYLLELTFTPALADPGRERADDLRALRSWLESLGATWKETSQDGRWALELRLPRGTAEVPGQTQAVTRTGAAVPGDPR